LGFIRLSENFVGPYQSHPAVEIGAVLFQACREPVHHPTNHCRLLFGLLGGYLTDLFGRRRVLVWSILLYAFGAFFAGSLLIETIFSLEGIGLLSFESLVNRDYPVVFATVYIFSLMGLAINLLSDLIYMWVDPRIDFETREV